MKTLTIIDTFGFFFRLYYAMSGLKNRDGKPSGMISGFANFIASLKMSTKATTSSSRLIARARPCATKFWANTRQTGASRQLS